MDLEGGLAESMVIWRGIENFHQTIDYEGIPFKCGCHHIYGYLTGDSTYPNKQKLWVKKNL
jgi:hypothetical protein